MTSKVDYLTRVAAEFFVITVFTCVINIDHIQLTSTCVYINVKHNSHGNCKYIYFIIVYMYEIKYSFLIRFDFKASHVWMTHQHRPFKQNKQFFKYIFFFFWLTELSCYFRTCWYSNIYLYLYLHWAGQLVRRVIEFN